MSQAQHAGLPFGGLQRSCGWEDAYVEHLYLLSTDHVLGTVLSSLRPSILMLQPHNKPAPLSHEDTDIRRLIPCPRLCGQTLQGQRSTQPGLWSCTCWFRDSFCKVYPACFSSTLYAHSLQVIWACCSRQLDLGGPFQRRLLPCRVVFSAVSSFGSVVFYRSEAAKPQPEGQI